MLSQQGYLQILPAQDGLSLWGLENFSAGLQFNKDKRDFPFSSEVKSVNAGLSL